MIEFLANNQIALFAGFISLLALVAAIYHGVATRKHFRLSIKPHLSFEFGKIPDTDFFHITVTNQGLGPAIIKNFSILEKDEETHPNNPSKFLDIVEKSSKLYSNHSAVSLPHIDESLSPNNSIILIKLTLIPALNSDLGTDELLKQLIPFEIKIEYESMYKEKYIAEFPPKFN